MAVWVCSACLCRPGFHVRACERQNRGTLPIDLTELGAPWAAHACPDFDTLQELVSLVGEVFPPRSARGSTSPGRKTRLLCRISNPGAQGPRAAPQPLGLSSLFRLSNKPFFLNSLHRVRPSAYLEPTTARDQKLGGAGSAGRVVNLSHLPGDP